MIELFADILSQNTLVIMWSLLALSSVLIALIIAVVVLWFVKRRLQEEKNQAAKRIDLLTADCKSLEITCSKNQAEIASLISSLQHEKRSGTEKLRLLEDARARLTVEFENLANRIFEEKSEKFTSLNRRSLDQTISPLKDQIKEFKKRVEDVYDKESQQRQSLLSEIGHLKALNNQISEDAINLTKALKGENKTQGNWGEVILERVLEESGLRKGHEYDTQVNLVDDEGKRRAPDVIVHLPDGKDIVIDAKVSLLDYERYCKEEDEAIRSMSLKSHANSIRAHIKGLSRKSYEDLEGVRSLDFVLLFIPIEAAFLAAFEYDSQLFREAYDQNIIVVSPTTLLATLRTIQSIWRYERQNRNAEEIARQAGNLHDQIALVAEGLEDIGKHVARAGLAQEKTMRRLSEGSGNLVGRAQRLEKLGAKVNKTKSDQLDKLSPNENTDTTLEDTD
ncbi:MAG: DNA recombination protein RmuC [Pseudomonadales bacterium]